MKVSREQMVENRRRILQEAGRLFRERGFAAVTVADVMNAAGQTHGGFYGHFSSKDDLIAATIADVLASEGSAMADLEAWTDAYLSPLHRDNPGSGCPMACLAGMIPHQKAGARAAMADGLRAHIDRIANSLACENASDRRRAAIGRWAAMVGAVVLSRAIGDADLAKELLRETRAWLATGPQHLTDDDKQDYKR